MLQDWLLSHPRAVGETYFEHQRTALRYSMVLFRASLACSVHALVPALFQRTASRCVAELHHHMMRRTARTRANDEQIERTDVELRRC